MRDLIERTFLIFNNTSENCGKIRVGNEINSRVEKYLL